MRALISAKWEQPPSITVSHVDGDEKLPLPVDGEHGNDVQGNTHTPGSYGQQQQSYGQDTSLLLNDFQFDSEMGPVADISTFPPTMAPYSSDDNMGALTIDHILSSGFWDSMLVPGKLKSSYVCLFI